MRILTNVTDIFDLPKDPCDAVCITTNRMVRMDGRAVMGRGIAKEAASRFHNIQYDLAERLRMRGNHAFYMGLRTDLVTNKIITVITFPTKNDWRDPSDLKLIEQSARELVDLCDHFHIRNCYLPCPGCFNDGLDWETQVRPVIEPILKDDRFVIADRSLN